jgi:phosphatidylglycerophosphatase C
MADSSAPVVAAFDLDGTLTEGGSVFLWLRRLAGTSKTYRAALGLLVPLTVGAIRSNRWADSAKERLFHSLLAGRDVEQVAQISREFALEHLEHEGRSALIARLDWHRTQGHDVVIVSASPQIYVDVIAEALKSDGALGTRLAVDPRGRLTGSYLGKNCRGTEKMRRLSEWIESRNYPTEPVIYAYGNSRGDRRLLAGATHPFNAGKLGRLGALRKFPRRRSATEA